MMDSRFEEIYSLISKEYVDANQNRERHGFLSPIVVAADNIASEVRERIERAIQETKVDVRSDARHFLLVNFSEMIFEPLLADQDNSPEKETILNDIEDDVITILNDAIKTQDINQLGGGEILLSLANLYPTLKVSNYRLWN